MSGNGAWGFLERAMELPDGGQAQVAPSGRARIRFNATAGRFEESIDEGAWGPLGDGGADTGTSNLTWLINDDAAAGTDEDPALLLQGGDGAEVVETRLMQDSDADDIYLYSHLASLAPGEVDRTTSLVLGTSGVAGAVSADLDSKLTLRGHKPGDFVTVFREATLQVDASADVVELVAGSGMQVGIGLQPALAAAFALHRTGATYISVDSSTDELILGDVAGRVGFFGGPGTTKPTITGAKGGNTALASLLSALAAMNLVIDATT